MEQYIDIVQPLVVGVVVEDNLTNEFKNIFLYNYNFIYNNRDSVKRSSRYLQYNKLRVCDTSTMVGGNMEFKRHYIQYPYLCESHMKKYLKITS